MMGRLDLSSRGLASASALLFLLGSAGCAQQVDVETGGAGGTTAGGGGSGGSGGATTTSTSSSTPAGDCTTSDDCLDLNGQCVLGACVEGQCVAQPANQFGACDDGLFCTTADSCQNGACVGGSQLACAGDDACSIGVCDEATDTCVIQAGNNGAQCDDGDPCTYFGTCQNGVCNKGSPVDCGFLDADCTQGICDPIDGCKAIPVNPGSPCDDGINNQCAQGVCDPEEGCKSVPVNDGLPCDDGLFCTTGDACEAGTCAGGSALPCAPPGGCFVGTCDESFDTCVAVPGNDGASCEDGSPCTTGTTCAAGACTGGIPTNDGMACDDGTSCTTGEFCAAGLCSGGSGPTIFFAEDFKDNSKGWTLGQDWEIGPAKASMAFIGNPDPAMDHSPSSDNGVAGVVIGGDAPTNLHPYYYIESPIFDTSAASGQVILGFYRWLNSDYDPYMHNRVEVYNGNQWITLWTTGPAPGIMDSSWTYQQFNLTNYKNPSMRVRFGFDIGSQGVFNIGSWNIDDVLVASQPCP